MNSINLYTRRSYCTKRFYSTKSREQIRLTLDKNLSRTDSCRSSNEVFWSKVNSSDLSDNENPFIIVNNFLKKYSLEIVKDHINLQLIASILSRHIPDFNITAEEFNILSNITPVRLELPIRDKDVLVKQVGKNVRLLRCFHSKLILRPSGIEWMGGGENWCSRSLCLY
jgi:hypothetical protein